MTCRCQSVRELRLILYFLVLVLGLGSKVTANDWKLLQVKGYSQSSLGEMREKSSLSPAMLELYHRVWDEADYVVPPAENGAFFVTTNVVITPNQTWGHCPEDPESVPESECEVTDKETNYSSNCSDIYNPKSKT